MTDSYTKALRRQVRDWTAERDAYIKNAGGVKTSQSDKCQAVIDEAKAELERLGNYRREEAAT